MFVNQNTTDNNLIMIHTHNIYMYVCMSVCMYVCMCIYNIIYIYIIFMIGGRIGREHQNNDQHNMDLSEHDVYFSFYNNSIRMG